MLAFIAMLELVRLKAIRVLQDGRGGDIFVRVTEAFADAGADWVSAIAGSLLGEAEGDGQISLLIGRKDQWHKGFGTAAMISSLNVAFNEYNLYRVWADIPEYNAAAMQMFQHLGFVHRGRRRPHRRSPPGHRGVAGRWPDFLADRSQRPVA